MGCAGMGCMRSALRGGGVVPGGGAWLLASCAERGGGMGGSKLGGM